MERRRVIVRSLRGDIGVRVKKRVGIKRGRGWNMVRVKGEKEEEEGVRRGERVRGRGGGRE